MGFAGSGSNLYAYVGDDPVNATDPLGLMGFFAALADLFSGVMSGDFTWAVSCADFFTCLGAVAATEFGSFLRVATSTSGGGRQAPASAPPALTGSELSARLAQRPGFAPTRNNYTPAPPGRHFDPRYLTTVADAPVPSGKSGQPQKACNGYWITMGTQELGVPVAPDAKTGSAMGCLCRFGCRACDGSLDLYNNMADRPWMTGVLGGGGCICADPGPATGCPQFRTR